MAKSKTLLLVVGFCACVLLASASTGGAATYNWTPAAAATYNWDNSGVQNNWTSGFPNAIDDVANIQTMLPWWTSQTIDLNQAITVGTLNLNGWYMYRMIEANGGSLTFQVSSGSQTLTDNTNCDMYNGYTQLDTNVILNSPLIVNEAATNECGFGLYNGSALLGGMAITGVVSGGNGITKTGPNALWLMNMSNTFSGPVNIQEGYLGVGDVAGTPTASPLGGTSKIVTLGGVGTIGHLVVDSMEAGAHNWLWGTTLVNPIMLTGEGGAIQSMWVAPLNIGTTIGVDASHGGTPRLFVGKAGVCAVICFTNPQDNTDLFDTVVDCSDTQVNVNNRIFTGNVTVQYMGFLRLQSANNVGGSVYVASASTNATACPSIQFRATLDLRGSDFMPAIDPRSSGILALDALTSGTNINARLAVGAPQLGNGYMQYGSGNQYDSEGVFTGASLQPDLDNVYRFTLSNPTDGVRIPLTLDAPGAGVLTGGNAVEINAAQAVWNKLGTLLTNDANDFTGPLTINTDAQFIGVGQASGSPFGASTGAVNLNGGVLQLNQGAAATSTSKGALNIQGMAGVYLNANDNVTALTFAGITRNNNAVLGVNPIADKLGTNEVLKIAAGVPASVNGMVAPWIVAYDGSSFLNYDSTNGFTKAIFTRTDAWGGAADIVNQTAGGAVSGAVSAYAVRTAGALSGSGTLTIGSGGLILAGPGATHTANIAFPTGVEGIIYAGAASSANTFSGTITGDTGLTVSSEYVAYTGLIQLTGDNSATLSGQITIDQGRLEVSTGNALGMTGGNPSTVYINGTNGINGGGANATGSLGMTGGGTLNNPIILGPYGGTFENANGGLTLNGKITGSGSATFWGNHDQWISVANAGNDWSGGTLVNGCHVNVVAGSTLGTGPVIVVDFCGGAGQLNLSGTGNINSNAAVSIMSSAVDDQTGIYINCAGASAWGSLEGNGRVYFTGGSYYNNPPENGTLSFGGNGLSTEFSGIIEDNSAAGGNQLTLTKTGGGTFTLTGEALNAGGLNVNGGVFTVNGKTSGAGTVSVNGGGTLNGGGLVGRGITVNAGGQLAGSLTIGGSVTVAGAGATANMTGATISGGTFWVNNNGAATMTDCTITETMNIGPTGAATVPATFLGTGNTINGNVGIYKGSTFSGSNTINGALTLGHTTAGTAGVLFSGSNIVNSPGVYTILRNGTISGNNTFNSGMYVNYSDFATCTLSGSNTINGPTLLSACATTDYVGSTNAVVSGSNTFNGDVTIYGGTFKGSNTVNGSLTTAAGSYAVVAPSNDTVSAGTLAVVGTVTLDHSTTLNFDLGAPGTTGGGVNDLIDVTGDVSLDGTLNVNALTNFGPGTYTLLTYTGSLTGAGLTLGTLPAGFTYTLAGGTLHTGTVYDLNLTVATPWQPGDTNRDGAVNSLDIDAIYKHFGADATTQWKVATDGLAVGQQDVTYELHTFFHTNYADANLDRKTDFVDFQVLLDHWQASGSSIGWAQGDFDGSGAVDFLDFQKLLDYWNPGGWSFAPAQAPEPATLCLIVLGGLALLRRRK